MLSVSLTPETYIANVRSFMRLAETVASDGGLTWQQLPRKTICLLLPVLLFTLLPLSRVKKRKMNRRGSGEERRVVA